MTLLDGRIVAASVKEKLKSSIDDSVSAGKRRPSLSVILAGDNPAAASYVRGKHKACEETGIVSEIIHLPADVEEKILLENISRLNEDTNCDGILVQLPLPAHIDEQKVIEFIHPDKDVDGFHPVNVGKLHSGIKGFVPCTPAGIHEILRYYKIDIQGRHVVVVGRSNIVGKPVAALLSRKSNDANAVVTLCHSAAKDIGYYTRQADVLIAAIGKANYITADMVKPGAVVIDVGINRINDPSAPKGSRLTGDVDFEGVRSICSAITPVPGGVGPMTIAMLLNNTYFSYKLRNGYE